MIRVRHWYTDILKFYPDGSIDVATTHRCDSVSTRALIWEFANVSVGNERKLPKHEGRLPVDTSVMCIRAKNGIFPFEGRAGYIRLRADHTVVLSTIKPVRLEYMHKKKEARALVSEFTKLQKRVKLFTSLGVNFVGTDNTFDWALAVIQGRKELRATDVPQRLLRVPDEIRRVGRSNSFEFKQYARRMKWLKARRVSRIA